MKESEEIVRAYTCSIEDFLDSAAGRTALQLAHDRVYCAITGERMQQNRAAIQPELGIASYILARIIVSCTGDPRIIEDFARYEADRSFQFLGSEPEDVRRYIGQEVNFDPVRDRLNLPEYIDLTRSLGDEKWRLVHREVTGGYVKISRDDVEELLREAIRRAILDHLPLTVPDAICSRIAPQLDSIRSARQRRVVTDYGAIDESAYPPCVRQLISAVAAGESLPHTARFAITAFLHTIGMDTTEIVEMYSNFPDFDLERTIYQVSHITGGGGTEYTPPSCATMRTYGLCTGKDSLCGKVSHPLAYYRERKRERGRSAEKPADRGSGPAEHDDKDNEGGQVSTTPSKHDGKNDDHEDEHHQ
ncbi:MAG: DNA primase large subunit PriL [Methanoculleaceae archaeon]